MKKETHLILILFLLSATVGFSQQVFKSPKYGYSVEYPNDWYVKSETYTPNIDGKIIDGYGNSFIVAVTPNVSISNNVLISEQEKLSNYNLEKMLLTGNYVSIKIILRERRKIGNRLCYYVKTKGVLTNGGTLISDNFLYSSGNEVYHISSSYSEVNESKLSMISNKMIQSFKF